MTTDAPAATPPPRIAALHAALALSRGALLAAIGTLADRDFASALPSGATVVVTLAALAPLEREAIQLARAAIQAPERSRLGGGEAAHARAVPPQVVHDLAGARYETLLFIDGLASEQLDTLTGAQTIEAELAAIAHREQAVADEIVGRPETGLPARRNP